VLLLSEAENDSLQKALLTLESQKKDWVIKDLHLNSGPVMHKNLIEEIFPVGLVNTNAHTNGHSCRNASPLIS
jgi:hypothetical protein